MLNRKNIITEVAQFFMFRFHEGKKKGGLLFEKLLSVLCKLQKNLSVSNLFLANLLMILPNLQYVEAVLETGMESEEDSLAVDGDVL